MAGSLSSDKFCVSNSIISVQWLPVSYQFVKVLFLSSEPCRNFELSRVPSGDQVLIVADQLIGRDFPIHVITATTLELGEIRFETTAMPPH
jgi:hypothetical protein